MDGRMQVAIDRPSDPSDLGGRIVVTVTCGHGKTRMPWRRACGNGCHHGGPFRAQRCARVNPDSETLTTLAVMGHGHRVRCGCDEAYWMQYGQIHGEEGELDVGIQVEDRMLSTDERAALHESLLTAQRRAREEQQG
jgi:hypothetical protein